MAANHTYRTVYNYRPDSYFWATARGIHLISDIQGAERRRIYTEALETGDTGLIPPEYLEDALSLNERRSWGAIHPNFLGGEFLPRKRKGEVEIARITIASTTQDVTAVYARRVGKRIHYRVVDEYQGQTLGHPNTRTSSKPLTLNALLDFFLKGWDLLRCLECNSESWSDVRLEAHSFIVDASSSFYADFEDALSDRVNDWADTQPQPHDEDEEEEGEDESV